MIAMDKGKDCQEKLACFGNMGGMGWQTLGGAKAVTGGSLGGGGMYLS